MSTLGCDWIEKLHTKGYRITEPLRVIVEILANTTRALSVVNIYDLGRRKYPQMGLVTVYRTLEKLEELNLIQHVHQINDCHAYLRAAKDHEHILLCTRCGKAEFFSGDDLTLLIETLAQKSGFKIYGHLLQMHGFCVDCQPI